MIPSKILIVEDEIVSAKSLEIHLNKMGHTILGTATSGEKAIQMALASQPDLVLMDIKLSGEMDGIQAAGHIREHINVAIIYLTAHSGDETVQRALSTEPFGYLIKPFDPNELRIIIEVTLYKHRLQQQLTDALTNVRRSQQRYEKLVQTINGIVWELDVRTSKFTFVSQQAETILGYPVADWLSCSTFLQEHLYPDDHAWTVDYFTQMIDGKQDHSYEYRMKAANGRVVWLRDMVSVAVEEDFPVTLRGVMVDITELKEHQKQQTAIALLSSALRSADSRAAMLLIILSTVQELMEAQGVALALHNPGRTSFSIEASNGILSSWLKTAPSSDRGLVGLVLNTGRSYVSNDSHQDTLIAPTLQPSDPQALAATPLIARQDPIGVLIVGKHTPFLEVDERVLNALGEVIANAIQRITLHEQTEKNLKRLAALHQVDRAINSIMDLRVTFNIILDQVTSQLDVDAADIRMLNPYMQELECIAHRGFRSNTIASSRMHIDQGLAGRIILERRAIHVPLLSTSSSQALRSASLDGEDFITYYGVPLIAKGEIKGVLEIYQRAPFNPDTEWQSFLGMLAEQAALAIDNANLFIDMQQANMELTMAYDTTLEGWARALELREPEMQEHNRRVAELASQLAGEVGLSEEQLVHVRRGALLHDIGVMRIPDQIINKPGPLTDEEWKIVRQHPTQAFELLSTIPFLRPALDIPYSHHEKWDGSGYPRKLKGEQVPLVARIFAVVDTWDALMSKRSYRPAWEKERCLEYIKGEAGKHFDPRVVDVFLKMIARQDNLFI